MKNEPKLCPDCPLSWAWKQEAFKRLMEKQYTKEKIEPSDHRICMERRKILKELGESCPYYPETETLDYHTDPDVKQRLDRRKRQNLEYFL